MSDPITLLSGSGGSVTIGASTVLEAHQWDVSEDALTKTGIHFFGDSDANITLPAAGQEGSQTHPGFAYSSGGPKRMLTGNIAMLRNFAKSGLMARAGQLVGPIILLETPTSGQGWYLLKARIGQIKEAVSGDTGDPIAYSIPFVSHGPFVGPGDAWPASAREAIERLAAAGRARAEEEEAEAKKAAEQKVSAEYEAEHQAVHSGPPPVTP